MVGADGRDGIGYAPDQPWRELLLELRALPGFPAHLKMLPAADVWPEPGDPRGQLSDRALFFSPAGTASVEMVMGIGNGAYLHVRDPLPCEVVCCEAGNIAHYYVASGLVGMLTILAGDVAEEGACSPS